MSKDTIHFSWIPGNMTQVLMQHLGERREIHVDRVGRLFGRPALNGLYLSGRHAEPLLSGLRFQDL